MKPLDSQDSNPCFAACLIMVKCVSCVSGCVTYGVCRHIPQDGRRGEPKEVLHAVAPAIYLYFSAGHHSLGCGRPRPDLSRVPGSHHFVGQSRTWPWFKNQWCHFGIGASPILVYFSWDWDVHWGDDLGFDPWPHQQAFWGRLRTGHVHSALYTETGCGLMVRPATAHAATGCFWKHRYDGTHIMPRKRPLEQEAIRSQNWDRGVWDVVWLEQFLMKCLGSQRGQRRWSSAADPGCALWLPPLRESALRQRRRHQPGSGGFGLTDGTPWTAVKERLQEKPDWIPASCLAPLL